MPFSSELSINIKNQLNETIFLLRTTDFAIYPGHTFKIPTLVWHFSIYDLGKMLF